MSNTVLDPRANLSDDLPVSFVPDETIIIDPNFNIYKPQKEHDGVVYVQKCLVRKDQYKIQELSYTDGEGIEQLTQHPTRSDAFLVKETNFKDIGGGLFTFEKHYATFPTAWYEFEEVSYQTSHRGIINYRKKGGEGADWSKSRDVLAKAEHYYFKKSDIPTERVPDTVNAGVTGLFAYENDPNTGQFRRFTQFFNIAPQASLGANWENYTPDDQLLNVTAIAPDRIVPYMGKIYEFVRYTINF